MQKDILYKVNYFSLKLTKMMGRNNRNTFSHRNYSNMTIFFCIVLLNLGISVAFCNARKNVFYTCFM